MSKRNCAKNVIVIAPHPDDETLGCGGTLLKHKASGDHVACVFVTKTFKNQGYAKEAIENREEEIEKISEIYGFDKVYRMNYPTTMLDSTSMLTLIPEFSKIFSEFEPEVVYLPNASDVHSDHKLVFEAAFSCTKTFRYPFVKKVLMYETLSETEFAPATTQSVFVANYFENISEYLNKKIDIMKVYSSELGKHPFPRSERNIEALATYRGASSGFEYAEAFQLLKCIND